MHPDAGETSSAIGTTDAECEDSIGTMDTELEDSDERIVVLQLWSFLVGAILNE